MESLLHFNIFKKKEKPSNADYEDFLKKKPTMIWVMGPKICGNAIISSLLAESSKFQLIDVGKLLTSYSQKKDTFPKASLVAKCIEKEKLVPDDIVINALMEEILLTYKSVDGFIISGFPRQESQMKLFLKDICDVDVIIHINLKLNAFFTRLLFNDSTIDLEKARTRYFEYNKKLKCVRRKFENKIIDVKCIFPKEDALNRLLDVLQDDFGLKFDRLYAE